MRTVKEIISKIGFLESDIRYQEIEIERMIERGCVASSIANAKAELSETQHQLKTLKWVLI